MKRLDIKILKFLYGLKSDNDFHDVSVIFSFKEKHEYVTEETDIEGYVHRVKNTYSKYKPTTLQKVYSRLFNRIENKRKVDKCVISLDEKGFVDKLVKGELNIYALGTGDDLSYANNSICRINAKGIEYFENNLRFRKAYLISIISLLVSLAAILISLMTIK